MKKAALRTLLFLLICALLLPRTVPADTGPKPSLSISLTGMPQEDYYAAVLSNVDSYGPHHVHGLFEEEDPPSWVLPGGYEDPDYPAWQEFVDYMDADGFFFLDDLFQKYHGDATVSWNYWPPETFKLLLYFPESDTFLASSINERYAFKSTFSLDLTTYFADGVPYEATTSLTLIKGTAGQPSQLAGLLLRMAITILVEGIIAWAYGYRARRQLLSVIGVNAVTQLLLNLVLETAGREISVLFFLWAAYALLEIVVFLVEALLYTRLLLPAEQRQESVLRRRVVCYALVANVASFVLGLLLSSFLPAIF